MPVLVLPMTTAQRVKWKPLKALLVLSYFLWIMLMLPVIPFVLFWSIGMAVWDSVNEAGK